MSELEPNLTPTFIALFFCRGGGQGVRANLFEGEKKIETRGPIGEALSVNR